MDIVDSALWLEKIKQKSIKKSYRAMYSTLWNGIVTEPALMLIPIDDHMVHRGDGVFEAIRFTDKKLYLIEPHLERLKRSADAISLNLPFSLEQMYKICCEVQKASALKEGILRLFLGRGGGDFSPNPYSTDGSEFHVVATEFKPVAKEKYINGASIMFSAVPVKQGPFAQIKSLNYLQNVLMKKESVDKGFDFSIGLTSEGKVSEGPTENILVWSENGELVAPNFDYTLRGTTLVRIMDVAKSKTDELKDSGLFISSFSVRDLHRSEVQRAREVMMVGTTLGVLPITQIENEKVGSGKVGPLAQTLLQYFEADLNL